MREHDQQLEDVCSSASIILFNAGLWSSQNSVHYAFAEKKLFPWQQFEKIIWTMSRFYFLNDHVDT